jgi:hypothetical protein
MELERGARMKPRDFIHALEQNELDLIDALAVNGAEGIIGQRSRQTLRRKPSAIYWSALRTFGFMSEPVSLSEYAELFCARRSASEHQGISGKRRPRYDEDTTDDSDTGMSGTSFWRVPVANENWRENVTIELSRDEAHYLRDRILSMPKTRESLLSLILREKRYDFVEYESIDDINGMRNIMPDTLWHDYQLARDFSRFIYGAQIMYNVIFSEEKNDIANEAWREYKEEKPSVNLSEIQARLKPRTSVMSFLKRYQAVIDNEAELKKLIVSREKQLKGPARAKLTNKELYMYDDNSVNMERLNYRLSNVQRIVRDIFTGVENDA